MNLFIECLSCFAATILREIMLCFSIGGEILRKSVFMTMSKTQQRSKIIRLTCTRLFTSYLCYIVFWRLQSFIETGCMKTKCFESILSHGFIFKAHNCPPAVLGVYWYVYQLLFVPQASEPMKSPSLEIFEPMKKILLWNSVKPGSTMCICSLPYSYRHFKWYLHGYKIILHKGDNHTENAFIHVMIHNLLRTGYTFEGRHKKHFGTT